MKIYSVTVKEIKEISLYVREKSKEKAIEKVSRFLNDSIDDQLILNNFFDAKPTFKFKAIKVDEKSNV